MKQYRYMATVPPHEINHEDVSNDHNLHYRTKTSVHFGGVGGTVRMARVTDCGIKQLVSTNRITSYMAW